MVDISNCPKTGVARKGDIKDILLSKEQGIICSKYTISYYDSEGNNIDSLFHPLAKRYEITTKKVRNIDPITQETVEPTIDENGVETYPEGLINEYELYSSLGWDYVLSINPEAEKVVIDGNYGVAYALLLRDDAEGLV